jgi:murein DD-endopeptidase MepM/ murein hydrolase activator NlpD
MISPVVVAIVATCWAPPVDAPVSRRFEAPACTWCPGHRGLEFATAAGTEVRAVAAGTVTFAGAVAGRSYVTVTTPAGWQITYGYLAARSVGAGSSVGAGQVVGVTGDPLLLTVRIGGQYVDPARFVGTPRWPLRLIPSDGAAPRPAGAPRLQCADPP